MMPKLKYLHRDFQVTENCVLDTEPPQTIGAYQYFLLRKSGYTTFEAIENIAQFFGVPQESIHYAGLKDEDAITSQFISVSETIAPEQIVVFNSFHAEKAKFLNMSAHGSGQECLSIGSLNGNGFRIVLRDVAEDIGRALLSITKNRLFFLQNYYGLQRFGIPDCPMVTHLVGFHLTRCEYHEALEVLKTGQTNEGMLAVDWPLDPSSFFQQLDPRKVAFYQNAYSSYEWNKKMVQFSKEIGPCDVVTLSEGIEFAFLQDEANILKLMTNAPQLEYVRFKSEKSEIACSVSTRTSIIQTHIRAGQLILDNYHPGSFECTLEFFLPSGCYATVAVEQLICLARKKHGT